jgi:hypothetical protein
MKKSYALIVIFSILFAEVFAGEYLQVRNVNSWWSNGPGIIDSASILIEPKGIYAECTLILEFAADESMFGSYDSLEADMNFKLPEGSEITDLVLWINDEPIQGKWYDRWTASLIYESIVQRRIDPAILTKVDANEFNIKIFPLLTYLKRKIKIRYLTPVNNLMASKPSVAIPMNILKLSSTMPSAFKIACKYGNNYSGARIRENENLQFIQTHDADFGVCMVSQATNLPETPSLNIVFAQTAPMNTNLITYTDTATSENYYQLAIKHSNIFESGQNRKALFLVDFIDDNCLAYNKSDILKSLEYSIRNTFSPLDSFNVLFSGMVTTFPEETWVPADSASISSFFNSLDVSVFNSYSNLPTLLIDGIQFVKNHGSSGSLVLISSSNSNGESNSANSLITDFIHTLEGTEIPIHIIDLDDQQYEYYEQHYIGGQYFRGNEYFYTRLSQLTVGEYYSVRTRSLMSMLEQVNHRISGYFKSLEVFVQTEGGYTYSNYKLNNNGTLVYNDEAFCLTGQYLGTTPFIITLFGQNAEGTVFQTSDTLYENNIQIGDSSLRSVWAAQKIRDLLGQEKSNQLINQIITTSLDEHVLTDYTAILVLEPGYHIPNDDDLPDNELTPTSLNKEISTDGFKLKVYPNPVTEASVVTYQVTGTAHIQLRLYDEKGQIVNTLVDETISTGEYQKTLHAETLGKGIYFCILSVDGKIVARSKVVVL